MKEEIGQHKITLYRTTFLYTAHRHRDRPTSHVERSEGNAVSFKVAIIGAGSVGFTKTLISDLLHVPEFVGCEFALTDINQHNLDMIK